MIMTATNNTHIHSIDLSWLEQYRHITVIGLGMSGVGVVKALAEKGIHLHVQDSRESLADIDTLRSLDAIQSIHLGSFNEEQILASDLLIMSPGVSLQTPVIKAAIDAGIEISSDVDIVTRSCTTPIIGITGSNGKSTVTKLAGELAQAAGFETFVGGNIGLSVMELLDEDKQYDLAVLELSSFQLEVTPKLNAASSVVLNLSPDHLDRYDSYQDYAMSKLAVYNNAKHCVWNREDEWLQGVELFSAESVTSDTSVLSFGLQTPSNATEFGILEDSGENGEAYFAQGEQKICSTRHCNLIGTHNHLNVLAALALLSHLSIAPDVVRTVLTQFEGLEHRMQKVREHEGVLWVNDSKATNVGATKSAIAGLQGSIILIAGGQGKGAEFDELLPLLKKYVKCVYLFGEDALEMQSIWQTEVECKLVASLEEAVSEANEISQQGDTVLLAPACASFDMFPSFTARGERFMELVATL